jgi:AraC-like DNA-binding protein
MPSDRRTQLVSHDHELGSWRRALRVPDARLAPAMYRPLLGFEQRHASFASWLEPPRPANTLMIDLEGTLTVDGGVLPDAWMAGVNDRYVVVDFPARYISLDLELDPLGAYTVLGQPLSALRGRTATFEDLFGADGRRVVERLRDQPDWDGRFDVIESFLLARLEVGPRPDPAVAWAWARIQASGGRARVDALAAELGCSRRYLHASFSEQLGLAPKKIARLVRFHSVRRRIERAPALWADIAFDAGYADQPHLNRDFRELAGTTPTDFLARLVPGGGVVGDQLPFVQDRAAAAP